MAPEGLMDRWGRGQQGEGQRGLWALGRWGVVVPLTEMAGAPKSNHLPPSPHNVRTHQLPSASRGHSDALDL